MATVISKSQTRKGEVIVDYNASNASNVCDDDISTYQSSSLSATVRIGIGNFNFNIPSEATISKVSFSTIADSTKSKAYIDRYICTNLTSSNTSNPPTPQLVKTRLFGTDTTISEPQEFLNEYASQEFENLITSAGLSTNIINFLNNDIDVYFVCAKSVFQSALIHIYDNKITVDYTVPAYNILVTTAGGGTVSGGGTYESGSNATIVATPNAGYKFVKWSDGNTSATRTVSVTANASYTAEFAAKTYSISYNGNGSTSGSVSSQSANTFADTTLTANAFKKQYAVTLNPNYSGSANQALTSSATFKGWEDRNDIKASNGTTYKYTEFDAPYYANTYSDLYNAFKYNKQSLVNHWANNGISEGRKAVGTTRGVYPDKAVVNTLNGIYADNGVTVRLYAQWSAMPAVTLPTPTRSGYNFLGWYTASSGGTQVGNTYTPTENVTLYAHWEVAKINKIYIGTDKPKSIYIGTNEVKSVYVGTTKVYG